MARQKDDRKIVNGVQMMVGGEFRTITDPDELEEVMTAEQAEYLKEQKAIEGDNWNPQGEAQPAMPGSPAHRNAMRGEQGLFGGAMVRSTTEATATNPKKPTGRPRKVAPEPPPDAATHGADASGPPTASEGQ